MKVVHLAAFTTVLAFHAATVAVAQPGGSAGQFKTSTYQPGIDILDYDVSLALADSGTTLLGDMFISLRHAPDVKTLTLDMVDSLGLRRVEVNGKPVSATHAKGKISIPLSGTRDSVRVRVIYIGRAADGLIIQRDGRGRWTWFGDNWPDRARYWLPTVDHPSDKATVSWRINAPATHTVVANGSLVSRKITAPGRAETRWRESRPITTYVMTIAVAPFAKYDVPAPCHVGDMKQCVRQSVYVLPENRAWLPGVFTAVDSIISYFETLVGPFPYEKLAHLQSNTRFGGMENSSAIFYDGKLFEKPSISVSLLAHETAHQWFGDAVTEREWSHLWLSEGFATYFAALYTKHARGDSAFYAEMAAIRNQILAAGVVAQRPVIDTQQTNYMALLNTNSYQKGGYILYMLHEQIGDSAFFGALRSYYATYRHGTVLTDDLRAEFEKTSERALEPFFTQWLRRAGLPELTVRWTYDESARTETVVVEQNGSLGLYDLDLPVAITDGAGVSSRMSLKVTAQPRTTILLPGTYQTPPKSITFDPDKRVLARIIGR